jgi:hypothetical protein
MNYIIINVQVIGHQEQKGLDAEDGKQVEDEDVLGRQ